MTSHEWTHDWSGADEPMTPWPDAPADARARVGVVIVNWNTRPLLARALFGILGVIEPGVVAEVVVVDNASEDGSIELMRGLEEACVVRCIYNRQQRYHGPGLTQGVNLLSELAADGRAVNLVWTLDSDVFVLRPDAVAAAARSLRSFGAVLAAELETYEAAPPHLTTAPLGACSTLFDPTTVWQRHHRPFLNDGEPSRHIQADLVTSGHRLLAFPFCADGYVLHLGRSTLAEVLRRGQRDNLHHEWARGHHEPHFALRPDGPQLLEEFEARFRQAVPDDSTATVINSLLRATAR